MAQQLTSDIEHKNSQKSDACNGRPTKKQLDEMEWKVVDCEMAMDKNTWKNTRKVQNRELNYYSSTYRRRSSISAVWNLSECDVFLDCFCRCGAMGIDFLTPRRVSDSWRVNGINGFIMRKLSVRIKEWSSPCTREILSRILQLGFILIPCAVRSQYRTPNWEHRLMRINSNIILIIYSN